MSSPLASPTANMVNAAHHYERPSVKLKIPSGKSDPLNSAIVDAAGHSLYTISSNSKRTTFVACKNNVEIATVQWDCPVPRMVFRRKKMKCRDWLPLAGPGSESVQASLLLLFAVSERDLDRSRVLVHSDSQFVWMQRSSSTSGYVCISYH